MTTNRNLTPTVITDRNGRVTTVHKKDDTDPGTKTTIPAPAPLHTQPDFGRAKRINKAALIKETLGKLEGFRAHDGSRMFNEKQMESIRERFESAKDNKELKTVNAAADALTTTDDREFLYSTLCSLYPTDGKRALLIMGNHLDIFEKNPGRAGQLYHLDKTLTSRYGVKNNHEHEVDTLRVHMLAKMDYPFGAEIGFGMQYEMCVVYFDAIQNHPELAEELMRVARTADDEQFLNPFNVDIIVKVSDELPERMEEFLSTLESRGGIGNLQEFMNDRGLVRYRKEVIESYMDNHTAVSEGWL